MEKEIKIAAKLYECRDAAKRFWGEEFKEKLKPFTRNIHQVMLRENMNEINALLLISKMQHYQSHGMAQMMYMAAVVELIEPS